MRKNKTGDLELKDGMNRQESKNYFDFYDKYIQKCL